MSISEVPIQLIHQTRNPSHSLYFLIGSVFSVLSGKFIFQLQNFGGGACRHVAFHQKKINQNNNEIKRFIIFCPTLSRDK